MLRSRARKPWRRLRISRLAEFIVARGPHRICPSAGCDVMLVLGTRSRMGEEANDDDDDDDDDGVSRSAEKACNLVAVVGGVCWTAARPRAGRRLGRWEKNLGASSV